MFYWVFNILYVELMSVIFTIEYTQLKDFQKLW